MEDIPLHIAVKTRYPGEGEGYEVEIGPAGGEYLLTQPFPPEVGEGFAYPSSLALARAFALEVAAVNAGARVFIE